MWLNSSVPIATGERMKLFMAAHKLLMFVLHDVSAQTFNDEEQALHAALKPLVENKDGHFVAAVTSLVQLIVRVLVRGSNYGTNSSRTVTTSCNPKNSWSYNSSIVQVRETSYGTVVTSC